MDAYLELEKRILMEGDVVYEPRTEVYTIGISGHQSEYDLREGFPLVTTKNVPPRLPFEEVLWKLRGERSVKSLVDRDIHFWTANAFDRYVNMEGLSGTFPKHTPEWDEGFEAYSKRIKEDPEFAEVAGDLGPVYGYQLRHWNGPNGEVDQLENVIKGLKNNPHSRYHVLNAWNPGELGEMALGPCPFWHQFTAYDDQLDLHVAQRSADTFLGVPFNIAQDALLLSMMAKETGFNPRNLVHTTMNTHLYLGVDPRASFWKDESNVSEFRERLGSSHFEEDFLNLREWYVSTAGPEGKGNEGKDHVPSVLEQLSKTPKDLPIIDLKDIPFMEAINLPSSEIVEVKGYDPHKWKYNAIMAA